MEKYSPAPFRREMPTPRVIKINGVRICFFFISRYTKRTGQSMMSVPIFCALDLHGTLCVGGSAKDSVEINVCATLAKYLFGRVAEGEFIVSEEKEKLSYKEYMIRELKLDKGTHQEKTQKIVETFPHLYKQYTELMKIGTASFLLLPVFSFHPPRNSCCISNRFMKNRNPW